jgi:8-oxo-dGTP diphosphatase
MKLATLCYVRRDGQTLMIHRVKKANDMHQGKWNGLGGKLNPGESPEECAVREIHEESGLRVRDPQLKGFLTFPAFAKNEDWYVFVYVVKDFEGELIDSPEGDLRWVDDTELTSLNLWEGDPIFLPWLDKPGIFSGKFIYKDGRLVSHEAVFHE